MDPATVTMLMLVFTAAVPAAGVGSCAGITVEIPVERTIASAAVLPNLLRLPHSLQAESQRMLGESERVVPHAVPPPDACPRHCTLSDTPEVVFRSAPVAVLDAYEDADRCERLLDQTSQQPLVFEDREFDSTDDLRDWVGRLTRGKGEEGELLYRVCDGCSLTYVWIIAHDADRLVVDAEVTCGHARDRDDNRYEGTVHEGQSPCFVHRLIRGSRAPLSNRPRGFSGFSVFFAAHRR